jgi:cysteinyl-tRNA synthetase
MHNEFYDFKGEKMSKSKGNIALLDEIVEKGIEPLAFRYFFLQAHYRQQVSLTDEALESARTGYRRLLATAANLRGLEGEGDPARQAPFRDRFRAALRDDLNAPQAMAVTWDVARSKDLPDCDRRDLLMDFDEILALDLATAALPAQTSDSDPRIDALIAERDAARRSKDFAAADRIRDELAAEHVEIVDTPAGTRWRRA